MKYLFFLCIIPLFLLNGCSAKTKQTIDTTTCVVQKVIPAVLQCVRVYQQYEQDNPKAECKVEKPAKK